MIERTDFDRDTEIHETRERVVVLEATVAAMLRSPIYAKPDATEREKALEQTIAELRAKVAAQEETIRQLMVGPVQIPAEVWPGAAAPLLYQSATIFVGQAVPPVNTTGFTAFPPTSLVIGGEQRPGADQVYRGPAVSIVCASIMPSGTVLNGVFTTGAQS
jgi:hypothetical protein